MQIVTPRLPATLVTIDAPLVAMQSCSLAVLAFEFSKVASGSPHPDPIDLHLLRKYCAAVWTADKVTPDGYVEENKELALEFGRAVHSA